MTRSTPYSSGEGGLLPCPFCGGKAKPINERWSARPYHGVQCEGDCVTFFDCREDSPENAAAAWNTRVVSPGLPVGEGQGAVWHRADSAGQVLLYTLRQDGWRKGEPIMVNDIEVRIQASNGAVVDLEAVVDAVWFGLQAAQQEQANDRR